MKPSKLIKKMRKDAGLTQSDVARIMGWAGKNTTYLMESGRLTPTSQQLEFLAFKTAYQIRRTTRGEWA